MAREACLWVLGSLFSLSSSSVLVVVIPRFRLEERRPGRGAVRDSERRAVSGGAYREETL